MSRQQEIAQVTYIGSLVNIGLTLFKLLAGLVGQSAAMIADAIHSLSDLLTDFVIIVCSRFAGKPRDADHAFGHGKYETVATGLVGLFLAAVGLGICWNGAITVWHFCLGESLPRPGSIALTAALVSIVSKEALYRYTRRRGEQLQSQAVVANAWHHRSDALSSVATAVGIGGAILLGESWRVLDPLAAIFAGLLIVRVSALLLIPCWEELLEKSLPVADEEFIRQTILSFPGTSDPHNLRTRRIGTYCAIEVHFRLDGRTTILEAHALTRRIEDRLRSKFGPETIINTHVEPLKAQE